MRTRKNKSIVPLNEPSEAFSLFKDNLIPKVVDIRGEEAYFDLGDYVHLNE